MADSASGYGNINFCSVFAIYTDQNLSSRLKWRAYDNNSTFPTTDSLTTTTNPVLKGTVGNSWESMVGLISASVRPGDNWLSNAGRASSTAHSNRIAGVTYYVLEARPPMTAGQYSPFNMVIDVPSDVETSYNMKFNLEVEYSYTGTAPNIAFMYNCTPQAIAVPKWSTVTGAAGGEASITRGIKHCRANSTPPNDLYANIPVSGVEKTAEAWICKADGS